MIVFKTRLKSPKLWVRRREETGSRRQEAGDRRQEREYRREELIN